MRLATRRFLLRDFADMDLPALRAAYADPRFAPCHGPGAPGADALHQRFVAWAGMRPRANYQFAVATLAEPDALCGNVGVRTEGQPPGHGEVGIELWPQWWGRHGVALELLDAVLAFAFRRLGLDALSGQAMVTNHRALRLLRHYRAVPLGVSPAAGAPSASRTARFLLERAAWERRARLSFPIP